MKVSKLKEQTVPKIFTQNEFKEIIIKITNKSDFNFVIENELHKNESDLFWKITNEFNDTKKPLAYILENKYFYNSDFYVNENVLIPRPETELIVEEVLKLNLDEKNLFDVCCGSGCIGISIKNINDSVNLYLSDISPKALEVTKINLDKHKIKGQLICSDYLEVFKKVNVKPDVITINPPYIDIEDQNVGESVRNYEPHIALFAENNGLIFYEKLFNDLDFLYNLNKELTIFCEFGFSQKEELEKLFSPLIVKYNIDFKKDYANNWRMFVITSKESHG
ncbi:peptide chain release factor N(5)-glutamine methyltransferase [Spiroplasma sp. BIUS-1]|uniref:peptide chain release factor N(5)-glutamine methyltransferase n=1 Tax=Spiroplasma sp. BIUS-1 TaxID=216964 RepID=UPI0013996575|nr:peptide chain release factor N(5)-glutamine methyltransferase [Spiroplasma sp. BIUS-1]QHX37046.1 release factor glutamine methyltransferase [Spiroplasma sp. BIUS-1]